MKSDPPQNFWGGPLSTRFFQQARFFVRQTFSQDSIITTVHTVYWQRLQDSNGELSNQASDYKEQLQQNKNLNSITVTGTILISLQILTVYPLNLTDTDTIEIICTFISDALCISTLFFLAWTSVNILLPTHHKMASSGNNHLNLVISRPGPTGGFFRKSTGTFFLVVVWTRKSVRLKALLCLNYRYIRNFFVIIVALLENLLQVSK